MAQRPDEIAAPRSLSFAALAMTLDRTVPRYDISP
jgi:hypothetical protein